MNPEIFKSYLLQLTHTTKVIDRWKLLVLIFMVSVYPLVAIPGDRTGFTLPKYIALALAAADVYKRQGNGFVRGRKLK